MVDQSPLPRENRELVKIRANRINVIVRTPAGSYEPGTFDAVVR
ncbi:hypothetical protein [Actinosynnema sp. NPDC023587]